MPEFFKILIKESATLINLENNLNATRTELTNAKTDVADLKTKLIGKI